MLVLSDINMEIMVYGSMVVRILSALSHTVAGMVKVILNGACAV
jgi:hypothetical protein